MRRVAIALLLAAACSGNSDDDDDATSPRDAGAVTRDAGVRDGGATPYDGGPLPSFCEARCDFETRCNPGETSDYCGAPCTPWSEAIRPAALEELASCLGVGADCSAAGDEDSCFAMAAQAAGTRALDTMLRDACTTKHTACGDTFPVAICADTNNIELYVDSVLVALNGCFAPNADCMDVFDCFLAAIPSID